jgi:hypothetical protein
MKSLFKWVAVVLVSSLLTGPVGAQGWFLGRAIGSKMAGTAARAEGRAIASGMAQTEARAIGSTAARTEARALGSSVARTESRAIGSTLARTEGRAVGSAVAKTEGSAIGSTVARTESRAIGSIAKTESPALGAAVSRTEGQVAGSAITRTESRAVGSTIARTESRGVGATVTRTESTGLRAEQLKLNYANGKKFETEVITQLQGAKKPAWSRIETSVAGTGKNGATVFTKPDMTRMGAGNKINGLIEIKNAEELYYGKQFQAQVSIARQNNKPLTLIVSQRNQSVSKPLQEAIRSTGGKIIRYDSAAGRFSRF